MLCRVVTSASPCVQPASALGDSMDQLSQQSSSERTQFMSREDLDQEGSLDLDHDQYHYQDQDPDQDNYSDQELESHQGPEYIQGANHSTPAHKTLELKVRDDMFTYVHRNLLTCSCCKKKVETGTSQCARFS